MSKYIKLDDINIFIGGGYIDIDTESFINAPVIDIVHCGECRHKNTANCPMAWFDTVLQDYMSGNNDSDFCSDGERI